jgi:uncharacterized protein (DUF1501 family)
MEHFQISRRTFLASACCAAASPLFAPVTFAAAPGDKRFVTIVLRGALDSLYLVQPYTDPLLKQYRPDFALDPSSGLHDLDGRFGLHPDAAELLPLWKSGDLGFIHAVSTPYRDTRSHFDGQDILENGGVSAASEHTGWLNRALSAMPRRETYKAIDVNTSAELILSGPTPVDVWSQDTNLSVSGDEMSFYDRLYHNDAPFSMAFKEATATDADSDATRSGDQRKTSVARLTAGMLKKDYRIATFSIGGWDTHIGQQRVFRKPLKELVDALVTLKTELGPEIWAKTSVLAMTEFGRTVRQNGSVGTDHGTGGLAIIAGGAIRGGKVYGKWPGLKDTQLFENRDLMPTGDVREIAAAMLNSQFNISAGDLSNKVFPGLDLNLKGQEFLRSS